MDFEQMKTNITPILDQINAKKLVMAGTTGVQLSSERTLRIDLKDGAGKDGINRIKITNMDGKLRIYLLKVEEVDVVDSVPPEKLADVLQAFVGIDLSL